MTGSASRWFTISLAFIILLVGGYFLGKCRMSSGSAPTEFTEARARGAVISQEIVNLSNEISGHLEEVNRLDREGNSYEALEATTELLKKTTETKKKAAELSKELEAMAASLLEVKSREAQQAAMESITHRMALISRLLSYTEYLVQLAETLQKHFAKIPTDTSVGTIVSQINAEITAINNFNRQAGEAMDRFDRVLTRREG